LTVPAGQLQADPTATKTASFDDFERSRRKHSDESEASSFCGG
jgi:hypothetical protein